SSPRSARRMQSRSTQVCSPSGKAERASTPKGSRIERSLWPGARARRGGALAGAFSRRLSTAHLGTARGAVPQGATERGRGPWAFPRRLVASKPMARKRKVDRPLRKDVRFLGEVLGEVLVAHEGERLFYLE